MSGFSDPILDGSGNLTTRSGEQSPNFVHGVSGWRIAKDGSAEFNNLTIRGTFNGTDFIINSAGIFLYSSAPATGNLVGWWTVAAGTDAFGNAYTAGLNTSGTNGTFIRNIFGSNVAEIQIQPQNTGGHTWTPAVILGQVVFGANPALYMQAPGDSGATHTSLIELVGGGAGADQSEIILTTDAVNINTTSGTWTFNANGSLTNTLSTTGNQVAIGASASNDATFAASRSGTLSDVFSARVDLDTTSRLVIESGGRVYWGPGGSTAVDTYIERTAAAQLSVKDILIKAGQTWQTPSLGSGWAIGPTSGTFLNCRYRRNVEDEIVIQGSVHSTSATPAATIFTLPAGFQPGTTWRGPGAVQNRAGTATVCFVEVTSAGAVSVTPNLSASSQDVYFMAYIPAGVIA